MSRSNSHRFNSYRFNSYRFDSHHFDSHRLDSHRFTSHSLTNYSFNGYGSGNRSLNSLRSYWRDANRLGRNKPCGDSRHERAGTDIESHRSDRQGDGQGRWDGTAPPDTAALSRSIPTPIHTPIPTPMQTPMQMVRQALHYFEQHAADTITIASIAAALDVREPDLEASFDQVRGMTPAQALLEHRLNRLFQLLSEQPRLGLKRAIQACGLAETADVVALFEQTFGIEMMLFLLTCRRAAEDRLFRRLHPEAEALVLPS